MRRRLYYLGGPSLDAMTMDPRRAGVAASMEMSWARASNVLALVMLSAAGVAASGCCEGIPEDIWNTGSYPSFTDTWRCESPVGEVCFSFARQGIVETTEAGGGGTGVHNWESECSGLVLYGPFYDEAVLGGFSGSISSGRLSFNMDWGDVGIAGPVDCVLEDIAPGGHVCP